VIGKLSAQYRAMDFRDFPDQIDRQTGPALREYEGSCNTHRPHRTPEPGRAASPAAG
jgi:hypothetical protein